LGREITPIKHGKLCLLQILEQEKPSKIHKSLNELEITANHHATMRSPAAKPTSSPIAATLLGRERKGCAYITQGSWHFACFTTGDISVLTDMNMAHNVLF